ncbi:hypothetical protein FOC1_g10005534 [Fusarium oxysporum f. sp. cubense race 1]|uniref:DUF6536 domain-containing protein n=1 Tax=Fusarium oxysporum f. sp. cubense (strain race 1) TaxID=1229664 RepID=N4UZM2_FUSC1|nr:hypothetical protein FOC1_g10005534 [Fusarium oxysporum f. sp. cubense race 1]
MQVLVAPTRKDVDCAHASKRWVEIGVPSIHNFRFISKRRILLWALFSLTGIPLHLVFNGSILESKATNGFVAIMASETFLDGARFTLPSVTTSSSYPSTLDNESPLNKTIRSIKSSLDTGVIYMNETKYEPAFQTMKVDYCLSERFHAPCRLSIANPLLLIVCIMCLSKCLLCAYTLKVRSWKSEEPLMTVGDAISSFIAKPDTCTKGMCTLDAEDLHMKPDPERALSSPRPWKKKQVVAGNAVNPGVWILSYMLIGSLLVLGGLLLAPALQTQSLRESRFAHHHKNADVNDSGLKSASLLGLTMISNTPQLLLSLCYMTLNGLITRMLAEFEWASYGIQFKALRVTSPRGIQRSTYRLQLPYRWSIPLLAISSILHWVYSNCFYLSNYECKWFHAVLGKWR